MSSENILYVTDQIVNLQQIHNTSLRTLLKTINTLIAIYHARNSFTPDVRLRMEREVVELMKKVSSLEEFNEKIQTRVDRLEKTLDIITKNKIAHSCGNGINSTASGYAIHTNENGCV